MSLVNLVDQPNVVASSAESLTRLFPPYRDNVSNDHELVSVNIEGQT